MPGFGKRVDGLGGRRRSVRDEVLLGAAAITIENCRSVIVEDVCPSGAKLRGRNLPGIGASMLIKTGTMDVLASVAWVEQDSCGVTFEFILGDDDVTLLKKEGHWANLMGIKPVPSSAPGAISEPRYELAY